MLTWHDSFFPESRISKTNVNLLAAWIVVVFDAAGDTVVFLRFPSGIVETERVRVLSSGSQTALEATETLFWEQLVAVVACFIAIRYDIPFLEHGQRGSVWASQEAFDGWNFDDTVEEATGLFQGPGVVIAEIACNLLADLFWSCQNCRWTHRGLTRHLGAAKSSVLRWHKRVSV